VACPIARCHRHRCSYYPHRLLLLPLLVLVLVMLLLLLVLVLVMLVRPLRIDRR
jgi:hypothetical protein